MYPFTYVRGFFTDFLKRFVYMYYWAPPGPPAAGRGALGRPHPGGTTRTPRRAPPSAPRPRPAAAEPHGARGAGGGGAAGTLHVFLRPAHDRAAAGRNASALFGRITLITNNNDERGIVTLCASHAFQSQFRVSGFGVV